MKDFMQLPRSESHSFYIMKFPYYIIHSDLWRTCSRFGKVCDVYISKKMSCMGKHFGFVRFSGNVNVDHMIENLCDMWFGYHKMFVSVHRTPKKDLNFHREPPKVERKQENFSVLYENVVRGCHSEKYFLRKKKIRSLFLIL